MQKRLRRMHLRSLSFQVNDRCYLVTRSNRFITEKMNAAESRQQAIRIPQKATKDILSQSEPITLHRRSSSNSTHSLSSCLLRLRLVYSQLWHAKAKNLRHRAKSVSVCYWQPSAFWCCCSLPLGCPHRVRCKEPVARSYHRMRLSVPISY